MILYNDGATFPSKFGANVSHILITPSPVHTHSQHRAFKGARHRLSASNRKKINQQFFRPRSQKSLCTHERLKSRGAQRPLIEIQTHRRNLIPSHRMSAHKGSTGRQQLYRHKLVNLWRNGILNNAKLKGKVWAAVREHMFSCIYAAINQVFNIFIRICEHGNWFDSKRGWTVI